MNQPTRPVLRYFGGKWILAPWIISHFPKHKIYVEPYGGAGSVLMRKPRAYAEVYNDLEGDIVNLFRVLRDPDQAKELERRITLTPFARDEFDLAYEGTAEPVERARKMIIRSFMGFGSDGSNAKTKTGFRADAKRSGSSHAQDWSRYPTQIQAFTDRLAGVVIENKDALDVMAQQDSPETLHFIDPPYIHETRGDKHFYHHEMDQKDHESLVDFITELTGMVILCGYPHPVYERLGWHTVTRDTFADGARARTEVLWLNPLAWDGQSQLSLI